MAIPKAQLYTVDSLILYTKDRIKSYIQQQAAASPSDKDIIKEEYGVEDLEEIRKILWNKVKEINRKMPTYKYVKEIILTEEELIKTTTLKIKRFEEIKKVL